MSRLTCKVSEQFKPSGVCLICLMAIIFVFSITAFVFTQVLEDIRSSSAQEADNEVNAKVVQIIMNDDTNSVNEETAKKFLLVNVEHQNDTEKLLTKAIQQQLLYRNKRDDVSNIEDNQSSNNHTTANRGYYEEQRPVVVHAESLPTLGRRQDDFGAPPNAFQHPYYEQPVAEYEEEEPVQNPSAGGGEVGAERYPYEQRQPAAYYDDDDDDESTGGDIANVDEGRAAQNSGYDSYYRQWQYATPVPAAIQRPNGGWEVGDNRKLQNGERDPYAAYDADGPMDDYEYPGALTPLQKQQYQQQLQQRQQLQQPQQGQNRPQQTTTQHQQQAVQGADTPNRPATTNAPTENALLSTLKSLKTMWDIYQAFAAAWNVLATHGQKQQQQQQQEAAKRRQQQIVQQMRINSKKPPKFETNGKYTQRNSSTIADNGGAEVVGTTTVGKRVKSNSKATKNPRTTTTKRTTSKEDSVVSSEAEEAVASNSGSTDKKTVGTKGDAIARQNAQGTREKRQMSDTVDAAKSTDVGEGRYIKGDPLKGYYDFVITEGSYKFWAVFQTGTALLIIYSTFAAIYYSKVNPLVSDYDYTDYLGGARSLSGGDDDFIDDDNESDSDGKQRRRSWLDGMLPRAGRTMKYILDALDKLPVDHREADEAMKGERLRLVAATPTSAESEEQLVADSAGVTHESDDTTAMGGESDANEEREATLDLTQQRQVQAYAA
ncbi:uncharacterized protein LOC128864396 [Anastrepha ludens]|uniref:uncharacterized protein LOC128864396 n=1 Tax=Anastrepha ludens TaxID=28586 RepID=UPI0023AEC222|nr:uncharacterized protein LOC128864396 [Anastrepha ludens]